ncbi:MAG TPA: thiamine-binding protein [Miltoncostaeales bacterium]|jgi:uncharacterized protein YqgV (UPF0045/DUF77 family)|nr:thiamine-binding protein [Miltoncostaeales bacterium]
MIMELQVLPAPSGTADDTYAHVDAAIALIVASGVRYEVGPLGTSVEGTPDQLWPLARAVHEATLHAGARSCVSIIKVADGPAVPTQMAELTAKHRS